MSQGKEASSRVRTWRRPLRVLFILALILIVVFVFRNITFPPSHVEFSRFRHSLDAYDFVEIETRISRPYAPNPFTDASLNGTFSTADGSKRWQVEGFCDADDGSI